MQSDSIYYFGTHILLTDFLILLCSQAVRTAAITLIGVLHMYMGAALRVLFESEKAALLSQIDAEIEKVKGEKAPPPTRGHVSKADGGGDADGEEEEEEEAEDAINVADLVPRNDIRCVSVCGSRVENCSAAIFSEEP